jgi:16S rRNA (guanine527-N7)-methyltransferase
MELISKYFSTLTARQREQFAALEPLYAEWNARINVISRREMVSGQFCMRHVLHSLAIARVCGFHDGARVLDVGTGGGFPAIPLAILFPGVHFTAVDSIAKKIRVVDEIARAVGLTNLTPVCERVETLQNPAAGTPAFDYAVSRAVAPTATLIGWVWPKVSRGMLLLKGGDLTEELAAAGRRYTSHNISDWFDDPFFETKKVNFIPKNKNS